MSVGKRAARARLCALATLAGVLLFLLLVTGISADGATVMSNSSFHVVETQPAANALDVPSSSAVTITFSAAVDPSTVSSQTLVVRGANGGGYPGHYETAGDNQIRFQASESFRPGEAIEVVATSGITGAGGEGLTPYSWQFSIETRNGTGFFDDCYRSFGVYGDDIAFGDLDQDGDLDAVTSNRYSHVWLNDGKGVFNGTGQLLEYIRDLALGDLDQDGDLDVYATGEENRVWLNNGQASFTLAPGGPYPEGYKVVLGDVDGDGDLDALVTDYWNHDNVLWLNEGDGRFQEGAQHLGSDNANALDLGDLDGDGDLDAFLAIFERPPEIWLNEGGGVFTPTVQSPPAVTTLAMSLGDVDGDGDLDALLATRSADRVLLNDGDGYFSDSGQALGNNLSTSVNLGDVDSDGDLDALIAGREPNGRLWINESGVFTETREPMVWANDSALGDVDGDGDLDAVLVKSSAGNQIWLNRTILPPAPFYISSTVPAGSSVNVDARSQLSITFSKPVSWSTWTADSVILRGDWTARYEATSIGHQSMLVLSPTAAFRPGETIVATMLADTQSQDGDLLAPKTWQFAVAARGQGRFFDSGQRLGTREFWSRNVEVGDMDGDGDLDVLVVELGDQKPLKLWFNDGHGRFTLGQQSYGDYYYALNLALGDLDGDGDLDVFLANQSDKPNTVWLNDGAGQLSKSGQSLGEGNSWDVALGDVDNDGDLDAFVVNNFYNALNRVWLNDGQGFFESNGQAMPAGDCNSVELGDLDGDGDLDAFVASGHRDSVWLNDGAGTFFSSGQEFSETESFDVGLGDLDDDGDLDALVVRREGSGHLIWLNDGAGFFSDSGQRLPSEHSRGVSLGDVDGDGDLDAFIAHVGGTWEGGSNKLWLNDGHGVFFDSGQTFGYTWDQQPTAQVSDLADLNGDGTLDFFTANHESQNRVWLNIPAASAYLPVVVK